MAALPGAIEAIFYQPNSVARDVAEAQALRAALANEFGDAAHHIPLLEYNSKRYDSQDRLAPFQLVVGLE